MSKRAKDSNQISQLREKLKAITTDNLRKLESLTMGRLRVDGKRLQAIRDELEKRDGAQSR